MTLSHTENPPSLRRGRHATTPGSAIDDTRDSPHARWVRVVETGTGWGESDPDVCAEAFGP
jgi:hypothetical protein